MSWLTGERYQASLGGKPQSVPSFLLTALNGSGAQIVTVKSVDNLNAQVDVFNSNGPRTARVLKKKTSGTRAGSIDMPNIGDVGVILPLNGDAQSTVWLGGLNTVETRNTLELDENYVSVDELAHRAYWKHETTTFWLLNKLGSFLAKFRKKAATEDDASKKSLDISLTNAGVLQVTHYRGEEKQSYKFSADQAGNLSLTLYKDDGATEALSLLVDKDGNVTQANAKDLSLTIQGKETIKVTGDFSVETGASTHQVTGNHSMTTSGTATINGGQELAFKSALDSLKSQLDDFVVKFNMHTHSHNPGPGAATPTGSPYVPVIEPPIAPTGTMKTKAG